MTKDNDNDDTGVRLSSHKGKRLMAFCLTRCPPKRCNIKIRPVGGGIFGRFSNFDKNGSQVAGDVISGVVVDYVRMDVRATFATPDMT